MSRPVERSVADLLANLKTAPVAGAYEIELRFRKLDRETFEQVYAAVAADSGISDGAGTAPKFAPVEFERTVNAVSKNIYEDTRSQTQYIRSTVFNGVTAVETIYRSKTPVAPPVRVNGALPYALHAAIEVPVTQFKTRSDALVRFKLRASHLLRGTPWRFDFTVVRGGNLSDFPGAILRKTRDELFAPMPNSVFPPSELEADSFELEIEYVGDSPSTVTPDDISAVAKEVVSYVDPGNAATAVLSAEISAIAEFVDKRAIGGANQLKQVLNQVSALSKSVYYADVWPVITGQKSKTGRMLATTKVDGARCCIVIKDGRCTIVRSNDSEEIAARRPIDPARHAIIDAEYLAGHYYAFELIALDGAASAAILSQRLIQLNDAVELASAFVDIAAKTYETLDEDTLRQQIERLNEPPVGDPLHNIPRDGIVFSEDGASYSATAHYKWKPYENNTIDFLAVKCPSALLGIMPYEVRPGLTLYLLFVGVSRQMRDKLGLGFIPHYRALFPDAGAYMPIQFSTSSDPIGYLFYSERALDRQIVELARNSDNTEWVFRGTRPDRKVDKTYYGNDYRVAELTYVNYIDPFSLYDLWTPSGAYFTKTSSGAYMASNKYKRYVVSMLMKDNISAAKWVIDLAAGRGGDLHRYQEIGVENALFIDVDPTAIAELIRRKFNAFSSRRHVRGWIDGGSDALSTGLNAMRGIEYDKLIVKEGKSLTIHTLVADLKTPSPDLIAATMRFGVSLERVDGIVCNFALHYMCDNVDNMRNLLTFVSQMLRVGGVFIFLVMDGSKVFDLLRGTERGATWTARDDPTAPPKYAFTRKYDANKLLPAGQTVSVLLPFSDEMYDEPLCNVAEVIKTAKKVGLEVEVDACMLDMMQRFGRADPDLAARLTDADKHYIGLHKYVTMRRVRTGGRR